jgi:hypothetical protein
MQPSFIQVGDDKIICSADWGDAVRETRSIVLTIRDGKIADMQACASMRQAKRFARRVRS